MMKRVLIIIGKLYIGGAERVGHDIGYYADKSKYEIHYLVFGETIGEYEGELRQCGCIIHHADPPAKSYIRYISFLTNLLQRERIDVIHSHTMFNSAWALIVGKYMGIPVRISHSHSIKGPEHRGIVKNIYEKTMRLLIRRYATDYVACGKSAGEWLYGGNFFEKNGTVIYNGIDLKRYYYDEKARDEIRVRYKMQNKFIIGHAGHFAYVKNQSFLLELMPEILRKTPNAFLILLGDGADRQMLKEKITQLNLQENVLMPGNVENVGDYMSAMDVFVFPSLYEGMPLALVEAQTNGLPCVISQKIPKDICLTDLISPISLNSSKEKWISIIISMKRDFPENYGKKMCDMGFDILNMLEKIYKLYEREN